MIETISDFTRFQQETQPGDWFVHVVPESYDPHSAVRSPSILFIHDFLTKKNYSFSFNHPDSVPQFDDLIFRKFLATVPNRKWTLDKKTFDHVIETPNVCDANLVSWMKTNEIFEISDYDTPAHHLIRKNSSGHDQMNLIVPLMKHQESFTDLVSDMTELLRGYEPDETFFRFNDLILGTLGELERQGIFVARDLFIKRFNIDPGPHDIVWSHYNSYTSTGRPSNSYNGVNYAALNQSDGTRKCFRSRYGKDGCMVVLDYTTFHPRIVSRLIKFDIPLDVDIYAYLAKLYFHKSEVDETDIKNSKALTFRQFYGGIDDKYLHIKYLASIRNFTNEQWALFNSNGYVLTPFFGRKIATKHISEPNPPKIFNYILQAAEGEIAIPKIRPVLDYLKDKHTRAVLYTYDAVLYDFYKPDGVETIRELRRIMSFDGKFPMKTYAGETYADVKLIMV